jgi:serine protease
VGVAERTQVVFASGMSSEALAARLASEADIEFAVPDRRKRVSAAPNDARYLTAAGSTGPASGQWYLRAPQPAPAASASSTVSSINAEAAWDLTVGSPSIVVAVLDTGIRFDHPDLKKVANGGNLLDGYDMVSDDTGSFAGTFGSANDGNGRDADASDPGDWVTSAEASNTTSLFNGCTVEGSSWHGTQTAGLIGALTNNSIGMASVGRTVRILPVRVLGKCGGYDSDIIAGMQWAAGIDIPGVPHNSNPAKVINMSLGGTGVCSTAYQNAISAITARGTVIVVSAGNDNGHAVAEPANCSGVIAVAGLRNIGSKVGYSDIGPEVSLSAPAGNCLNTSGACLFPILTTTNTGTTTPVSDAAGGSTYSDAFDYSVGTSFSAPLVAGTAALVLSAQPSLTPDQVRTLLRQTARAFPASGAASGTPQCTAPQVSATGTPIDQPECYCTTSTCGAGMLDAGAALQSVLTQTGLIANIRVLSANPAVNDAVAVSAASTVLASGSLGIKSYAWSVVGGTATFSSATDAAVATLSSAAGGIVTVSVTVVDQSDRRSTTTASYLVAGAAAPASVPAAATDTGGGGALGLGWLLALGAAVALTRRARQSA